MTTSLEISDDIKNIKKEISEITTSLNSIKETLKNVIEIVGKDRNVEGNKLDELNKKCEMYEMLLNRSGFFCNNVTTPITLCETDQYSISPVYPSNYFGKQDDHIIKLSDNN